jgi:hypothetical protein
VYPIFSILPVNGLTKQNGGLFEYVEGCELPQTEASEGGFVETSKFTAQDGFLRVFDDWPKV